MKEKLSIERAQVLIIGIEIDEHDHIESLDYFGIVTQLARKTKTNQSSNRIYLDGKNKKKKK